MSDELINEILRKTVTKISLVVGYDSIQPLALYTLADVLKSRIKLISKLFVDYSENAGYSQSNLSVTDIVLNKAQITQTELIEYLQHFEFDCVQMLPKFPVASEYSIDFLKPGDTEILSRPLHIPEYLPSMIIREQNDIINNNNFDHLNQYQSMNDDNNSVSAKKPNSDDNNAINSQTKSSFRSQLLALDINKRGSIREIKGAFMTASGYLSTSTTGKVPELMSSRAIHFLDQINKKLQTEEEVIDLTFDNDPYSARIHDNRAHNSRKRLKLDKMPAKISTEKIDKEKIKALKKLTKAKDKIAATVANNKKSERKRGRPRLRVETPPLLRPSHSAIPSATPAITPVPTPTSTPLSQPQTPKLVSNAIVTPTSVPISIPVSNTMPIRDLEQQPIIESSRSMITKTENRNSLQTVNNKKDVLAPSLTRPNNRVKPWNPEMFTPFKQKQSINEHEESDIRQRQTNQQFFKMQSTSNNFLDANERVSVLPSNFLCDIKTSSNEPKNVCGNNNYTDRESDHLPFQGKTSKIHCKSDTNTDCLTYEDDRLKLQNQLDVVIPVQIQAQESFQNDPERQVQTQLHSEPKLLSNLQVQGQQIENETVFQDLTTNLEHGNLVNQMLSSQIQEADNDNDMDTSTNLNSLTDKNKFDLKLEKAKRKKEKRDKKEKRKENKKKSKSVTENTEDVIAVPKITLKLPPMNTFDFEKNIKTIEIKETKKKESQKSTDILSSAEPLAATTSKPSSSRTNTFGHENHVQKIHNDESVEDTRFWKCPVCVSYYENDDAMICCDRCNYWHHWKCVGLTVAPNVDKWYCSRCEIEMHQNNIEKRKRRSKV